MSSKILKLKGGFKEDEKGIISFCNYLNIKKYKRFYQITLPKKHLVRAFHGHMKEKKAVFPLSGKILLCVVELTDKTNPLKTKVVKKIVLDAKDPSLYEISSHSANGIMSLEKNSSILFFSDKTLKESQKDDFRFDKNYWGKDIWK